MKSVPRRTFMLQAVAAGSALAGAQVLAQTAGATLEESNAQAIAMGYKNDTTKVDQAKFPKHAAAQNCSTCQLFQGKGKDSLGGCPIFPGKQVSATGWCSAWVKKA
jgi:hypothetical protein